MSICSETYRIIRFHSYRTLVGCDLALHVSPAHPPADLGSISVGDPKSPLMILIFLLAILVLHVSQWWWGTMKCYLESWLLSKEEIIENQEQTHRPALAKNKLQYYVCCSESHKPSTKFLKAFVFHDHDGESKNCFGWANRMRSGQRQPGNSTGNLACGALFHSHGGTSLKDVM